MTTDLALALELFRAREADLTTAARHQCLLAEASRGSVGNDRRRHRSAGTPLRDARRWLGGRRMAPAAVPAVG